MNLRTLFKLTAVVVALSLAGYYSRSPHRTALPFGTTDLSTVQGELARLSADERALVEAYVARSRGDVLPAAMADPDEPLTARTFGEAIALQLDWRAKRAVADARADQLRAQRDARVAPLRAVVHAEVVKAEILTRNEVQARNDPGFYQRPYQVDKSPTFLTRVRIENRGDEAIVAMKGSLHARDRESVLPMDLCWIDLGGRELPPGGSIELNCGHDRRSADPQQVAFVQDPPGRFQVEWAPHYVKLASGRELDSGL